MNTKQTMAYNVGNPGPGFPNLKWGNIPKMIYNYEILFKKKLIKH
jgi:hypothetical protein